MLDIEVPPLAARELAFELLARAGAIGKVDFESAHAIADNVLLARLRALGEGDLVASYLEAVDGGWHAA